MGDTGGRQQCPPQHPKATPMPRLALYALVVCALAVAAAVVSFVQGSWLGIVWVLLAGLSSNMAWYYTKRGRQARAAGQGESVTG
ncbi:hypothetical protein [Streptomyces camelliae]|uniref:Secreted protein n=1 Tax=Streptomyces camelliae TaxID=3004093 RepID=A0ABY7P8V1_9ACTN|nr:hypothetical protein [Streptomyces sp. HUAS 2-6]WBO66690.1 hypothetical protein O1G22_29765 [Streptomyces sp. HUAS 2-6]